MTGMIESVKAAKKQMDDRSIATDMLMGMQSAATAYFMAVLESATPELRSMFRSALNQVLDEYTAFSDLALNRSWVKPYEVPHQQLVEAYRNSQAVVSYHKE